MCTIGPRRSFKYSNEPVVTSPELSASPSAVSLRHVCVKFVRYQQHIKFPGPTKVPHSWKFILHSCRDTNSGEKCFLVPKAKTITKHIVLYVKKKGIEYIRLWFIFARLTALLLMSFTGENTRLMTACLSASPLCPNKTLFVLTDA